MNTIKVLSLWQPWASLVIGGAKRFETRSWDTNYRGPLLIHAAKRWTKEQRGLCLTDPFYYSLFSLGFELLGDTPRGCVLGVVELEYTILTPRIRDRINDRELAFGNYSDGRFAWAFSNPRPFPQPIQMRGFQGLWNCRDAAVLRLASEMDI